MLFSLLFFLSFFFGGGGGGGMRFVYVSQVFVGGKFLLFFSLVDNPYH